MNMYQKSIIVLFSLGLCSAQVAYHTDANTNAFAVKAPGSLQSFTRYFGGQVGSLLQQEPSQQFQAESQQQPQYATAPQNYASYQKNVQQQLQHLQQQQLQEQFIRAQQQDLQAHQQQQPAASTAQQQYISPQDYSAYLQQQVQNNQYYNQISQPEQSFAASNQQQQQLSAPQSVQQPTTSLLGVAYHPSTQVAHVKFSNGAGLEYNF